MFWSKNWKAIRCIFVFLFCAALLIIELNYPGIEPDTGTSRTSFAGEATKTFSHNKKADALAEVSGSIADGIANTSYMSTNTVFYRVLPLKHIFLKTVLLYIPLILWTLITLLLQDRYLNRRYLISFIHNSDGEKRSAIRIK